MTIDYRVRGFTRDINGMKHFIDHEINSIQNFMSDDMKSLYDMVDVAFACRACSSAPPDIKGVINAAA